MIQSLLILLLSGLLLFGCDNDIPSCVPGSSVACACSNARQGAQTCQSTGFFYDECKCDGPTGDGHGDGLLTDVITCISSKDCDDDNTCTTDLCDKSTCIVSSNTNSCDDADPCTIGDKCKAGICEAGEETLNCHDGNPCTDDDCAAGEGCSTTPNEEPCDDGDPCTLDDTCGDAECNSGEEVMLCNAPPDPLCEGEVAVSYGSLGTCTEDGCTYPSAPKDCTESGLICVDGECTIDPGPGLTFNGSLVIESLEDADAAKDYETITGDLIITDQAPPTVEFAFLKTIGGDLSVHDAILVKVLSMPKLISIDGTFELSNNNTLEVAAFPVLETIKDALELDKSAALKTFDLPALTELGGRLTVTNVLKLKTLDLTGITTLSNDLIVRKNTGLVIVLLPALTDVQGAVWISQLDDLKTLQLTALENVGGYLKISHLPKLLNLELSALTHIGYQSEFLSDGTLSIEGMEAVTVLALNQLVGIRGALKLSDNAFLAQFMAPELQGIASLQVTNNSGLVTLSLSKLTDIAPCWESPVAGCDAGTLLTPGWLSVSNNNKLSSLGLPVLTTVHHSIQIDQNGALEDIHFPLLLTAYSIYVEDNDSLSEILFPVLTEVPDPDLSYDTWPDESFVIADQPKLVTLTLGALAATKGTVEILNSPKLASLDLSTLESCGGLQLEGLGISELKLTALVDFGQGGSTQLPKPQAKIIIKNNTALAAFEVNPGMSEVCWAGEGILLGDWGEMSGHPKLPECLIQSRFGCGKAGMCDDPDAVCPLTIQENLTSCACYDVEGLKITCLGLSDCGGPDACQDENLCTINLCELDGSCFWVAKEGSCTDGDPCTQGDYCEGVSCMPGEGQKDCNDDESCTLDNCESEVGCNHLPLVAACDDDDPCTLTDNCAGGVCEGNDAVDCDDKDDCTDDLCTEDGGCIHVVNQNTDCDDGDPCSLSDNCFQGVCQPGQNLLECNDDNSCTEDKCQAGEGCDFSPIESVCDDGDPCTVGDACENGQCESGKETLVCDSPPSDYCDETKAIQFTNPGVCAGDSCAYTFKTVDCTENGLICTAGKCIE
jgi:hypothetical protein